MATRFIGKPRICTCPLEKLIPPPSLSFLHLFVNFSSIVKKNDLANYIIPNNMATSVITSQSWSNMAPGHVTLTVNEAEERKREQGNGPCHPTVWCFWLSTTGSTGPAVWATEMSLANLSCLSPNQPKGGYFFRQLNMFIQSKIALPFG